MTEYETALNALAIAIRDSDNAPELLLSIRCILTPNDFSQIALNLDICPIHSCDIEICIDDDIAECAHLR